MSNANSHDIPVLVVGAGPTGLMMAGELSRHGLACRIIDKAPGPSIHSKALGLQARTLEVFNQLGLADKAVALGNKVYGGNVYYKGQRIMHFSMDELDSPYPYILVLPQSQTEHLLNQHLESLGVKVERGVELIGLSQDNEQVMSVIQHLDGRQEQVSSQWVIGCDGAHSTVRHLLQTPFEGTQYDESFSLIDCKAEGLLTEDEGHIYMSEKGMLAVFPMGQGQYRIIAEFSPNAQDQEEQPTLEYFQRLLNESGTKDVKLSDPAWLTSFHIQQRKVKDYTNGRVFLAGDAAHIHSPIGGQGMNTGLQDAFNLGWKLALVANGSAYPSILDSYQVERREIARNLLRATDLATKVIALRNPIAQQVRNHLLRYLISQEVVQQRLRRNVSEITISYRHSPIVAEHHLKLTNVQLINNPFDARPTVRQWFDFGLGPRPGDRAPDAALLDNSTKVPTSVFKTICGTAHTLFLIADTTNTLSTLKGLAEIGRLVEREYAGLIQVVLVISGPEPPRELVWNRTLLVDQDLSFHHRYGADSECLYLIRPDGYVAFRSQPPEFSTLQAYLRQIFMPEDLNEEY